MSNPFPRTTVAGVSLSRMIIGTNWILGYSHTSPAADSLIRSRNQTREAIADTLEVFLDRGVDTLMGILHGNEVLLEGIMLAEDRTGKKVIRIDTPILN